MVQVRFMHHHNAGVFDRHFVTEIMMDVVAHLVERNIEVTGTKR
jgi:hypothetical protein